MASPMPRDSPWRIVHVDGSGAQLACGDCIEVMRDIEDDSIDMVLCDLPYGTTRCKWDEVIPLDSLWEHYKRIVKQGGAIVLFGSEPFSTKVRVSNLSHYCYDWVWDKRFAANFVQAKRQPLKTHENIMVFSCDGKMPRYNPQMVKRDEPIKLGGNSQSEAIPIARTAASEAFGRSGKTYGEKYPDSQLHYSCRKERGLHPTQKPTDLIEYLVRTYTGRGDVVLDNCMGSGSTGVACIRSGRRFVGIELDGDYYVSAERRIAAEAAQGRLIL